VAQNDTCWAIWTRSNLNSAQFYAINPSIQAVNCTNLQIGGVDLLSIEPLIIGGGDLLRMKRPEPNVLPLTCEPESEVPWSFPTRITWLSMHMKSSQCLDRSNATTEYVRPVRSSYYVVTEFPEHRTCYATTEHYCIGLYQYALAYCFWADISVIIIVIIRVIIIVVTDVLVLLLCALCCYLMLASMSVPGTKLCVADSAVAPLPTGRVLCSSQYPVMRDHSCSEVATLLSTNITRLQLLNPKVSS
jgi:hypothetical protein